MTDLEQQARELFAQHAEQAGYPLCAAGIRKGDDPFYDRVALGAMLAFRAAPPREAKTIAAAVVQSACETDPADPEHPDTILIACADLESLVRMHVESADERVPRPAPPDATVPASPG